MTTTRGWMAAIVLLACAAVVSAQMLPTERARQQQQLQQQVRIMARDLVGSVLDLQLRQLKENGLTADTWYKEIGAMREHLDELIAAEMPQVIVLLTKVETAGKAERQAVFAQAREKSREIVIRLLVERQALLRRLRMAEIVAQIEQLIRLEIRTRDATDALPAQPEDRRAAMNLTVLEDQRDIRATYGQFKEGLAEVSRWTGPFGVEAGEDLKLLATSGVDQEVVSAESRLRAAQFVDAVQSQQ
ncbi:MAG: hypothetical protein ABSG68_25845, partial [Thermoguttaceae bacterium]